MRTPRPLAAAVLALSLALAGSTAARAAVHAPAPAPAKAAGTHKALSVPPRIQPGTHANSRTRPGGPFPNQTSANWSGYAVTGAPNSLTSVSSNWVQSWVDYRANGAVGFWVGLDGFANGSVEQTGTAVDSTSGTPRYYAWYEIYPAAPVAYSDTVAPGDNMSATVSFANGSYDLHLADITQHWSHDTTVAGQGQQNASAEVIVEAPGNPTLPLDDFGFTGFAGSTVNGRNLAGWNPTGIDIADPNGGGTDTTSPYDANGYFTVVHGNGGNLTGTPKIAYSGSDLGGGLIHNWTPSGDGYMGEPSRYPSTVSIASVPGGGFEEAADVNTGQSARGILMVYGTTFTFDTQLGVMSGTSPAIAVSPTGGFEVVFQADTGQLWKFTPQTGGVPLGYPMMSGTSPSIAALPSGGYEIAFQANTGLLWEVGDYLNFNTQLGMKGGTSPSIAASANGGIQVAFQANTGYLWEQTPQTGGVNQGYPMAGGTSPSITALAAGGYETAFQANTGLLWEVGSYINFNTQLGMRSGTSPSITAVPGIVLEVAFQANTGVLWTQDLAHGGISRGMGMEANTSPAIAN